MRPHTCPPASFVAALSRRGADGPCTPESPFRDRDALRGHRVHTMRPKYYVRDYHKRVIKSVFRERTGNGDVIIICHARSRVALLYIPYNVYHDITYNALDEIPRM